VTVNEVLEGLAVVPTVTRRVELPPVATEAGLKMALTPRGSPEVENRTVCATPDVSAVDSE
jgi:hypothetical protein